MIKFTPLTLAIIIACCQYANAEETGKNKPWMNKSLDADQRAEMLVKAMSLDEKNSPGTQ
ncbi:hypothetical protein DZS_49880 [Dickeya ananatis]